MTERSAAQQLGQMIRSARLKARDRDGNTATQAWIGRQCQPSRTAQQISKFESGDAVPAEISALAEIYLALHPDERDPLELARKFVPWAAAWLAATKKIGHKAQAQELVMSTVNLIAESTPDNRQQHQPGPLTSLADFPNESPLTIILGDRREPRVSSAADCLIYSGSVTDAMFLPHMWRSLRGSEIRSDKLLVRMPQEYLEEQVPEISERDLLIIGSPAANWGARILNRGAIFPFRIDPDAVRQSETLLNDNRMQDEEFALEFWQLAQTADENGQIHLDEDELSRMNDEDREQRHSAAKLVSNVLEGSNVRAVMNRFRAFGILDPADQENHGTSTHIANDFAVVTVARNPYSKTGKHRSVICAGIHGPGTAAALRELLTNPDTFKSRPLGAVLEIRLRTALAWSERFERAKVKPQTREYEPQTVLDNINRALKHPEHLQRNPYKYWNPRDLEDVAKLISEILQDTADASQTADDEIVPSEQV